MPTQSETLGSKLLKLPPELLEWIARLLPVEDLLELRLSCRQLESNSLTVVRDQCFRERGFHLILRENMETLLEISEHPVFGRSLRRIHFDVAYLPDWRSFVRKAPISRSREERANLREVRRLYEYFLVEQQEMLSGSGSHVLKKIFRNLMQLQNIPKIFVSAGHDRDDDITCISLGACRLLLELPGCWEFVYDRSREHYDVVREALEDTKYPVEHLQLGSFDSGGLFELSCHDLSNSVNILGTLKTLRLTLAPTDTGSQYEPLDREILYIFLNDCRLVETLALTVYDWGFDDCIYNLLADIMAIDPYGELLPRLRVLELHQQLVDREQLRIFVLQHKATLAELHLRRVRDDSDASFQDTMGFLNEHVRVSLRESYNT